MENRVFSFAGMEKMKALRVHFLVALMFHSSEAEIQSRSEEDGSMLLCEYISVPKGQEISESANEKTGLNGKSQSNLVPAPGHSLELGSGPASQSGFGDDAGSKISKKEKGIFSLDFLSLFVCIRRDWYFFILQMT